MSESSSLQSTLVGSWSYRSFYNEADLSIDFNDLKFGMGTIRVDESPMDAFEGIIYGPGWQLQLTGSSNYGNPNTVRFQGKGVVGGDLWIYDYVGYLILPWPNGVDQNTAIVGSIVRNIPHPGGDGGVHPAGVVASWYAVKQQPEA